MKEDRGGFPFDENGNGTNGLSHKNEWSLMELEHQFYRISKQKSVWNLGMRNGVVGRADSASSLFWISGFWVAVSATTFSQASVSSSSSPSMPIGAEPELKNKIDLHKNEGLKFDTARWLWFAMSRKFVSNFYEHLPSFLP